MTTDEKITNNELKPEQTRRDFLKLAWAGVGAVALVETGVLSAAFFLPRIAEGEFGSVVTAGPVDNFPPNSVTPFIQSRFYLSRLVDGGFLALARMPGDPEPTAAMAVDRSYPEELSRFGHDETALSRLAEVGGGRVLADPAEAFADVTAEPVSTPLALWLFLSALFFYLVSVLLLRLPDDAAARAAAAKIARPSRWSEPPDEPRKRRWTPRRNGKNGKNGKKRKAA